MGRYLSWTHGTAVTVQTPDALDSNSIHFGWGLDVNVKDGNFCWFHIPLAVPSILDGYQVYLDKVYLLFSVYDYSNASLRQVDVYDGVVLLQSFTRGFARNGDRTRKLSPSNTFVLDHPRAVQRGISISFGVQGTLGPIASRVIVTSAGAEYRARFPLLVTIAKIVSRLRLPRVTKPGG